MAEEGPSPEPPRVAPAPGALAAARPGLARARSRARWRGSSSSARRSPSASWRCSPASSPRGGAAFSAGQLTVIRFVVGAAVSARRRSGSAPGSTGRTTGGCSGPAACRAGSWWCSTSSRSARIPAGEAGMLYNLFPVIATALEHPRLRRAPDRSTSLLALALATAGVVLVLGDGSLHARRRRRARRSRSARPCSRRSPRW